MNIQDAPRYNGKLMSTVDGGYPVIYYGKDDSYSGLYVYCVECANPEDANPPIVAFDVFYEGAPECCAGCGSLIESAYGDPDAEDN